MSSFKRIKYLIKKIILNIFDNVVSRDFEVAEKFRKIGVNYQFRGQMNILNGHNIEIGDNFSVLDRFRIEAWEEYHSQKFTPKIYIGNNVVFNTDIHIGCINFVSIGNNCLFGSRVYITDHDHGDTSIEDLRISPLHRKLKSKGPVIIEDNVYCGEGVVILSGVRIGRNAILGSNSVITSDVPENSVVAGVPARVIKTIC